MLMVKMWAKLLIKSVYITEDTWFMWYMGSMSEQLLVKCLDLRLTYCTWISTDCDTRRRSWARWRWRTRLWGSSDKRLAMIDENSAPTVNTWTWRRRGGGWNRRTWSGRSGWWWCWLRCRWARSWCCWSDLKQIDWSGSIIYNCIKKFLQNNAVCIVDLSFLWRCVRGCPITPENS